MSKKLRSYLLFSGIVLLFTLMFGINAYAANYTTNRRSDFQIVEKTFTTDPVSAPPKTVTHNLLYHNEMIAPTCTENGYIGGTVCLDCGAVIEVPEIIPPKGHTPKTVYTFIQNGADFDRLSYSVCADCGVQLTTPKFTKPIKGNTNESLSKDRFLPDEEFQEDDGPIKVSPSSSIIDFIINLFRKLFG